MKEKTLEGKKAVILVEELYNEYEFWYPKFRLLEADAEVIVAGPKAGATYKGKYGMPAKADKAFEEVDLNDIHGMVIPGGYCPDMIRRNEHALKLVKAVYDAGKTMAFICHAGWVPISAGIVEGKRLTSFMAIRDDLINAGAKWVDEPVVIDGNMITSRTPDDLPVFMPAIIEHMSGL